MTGPRRSEELVIMTGPRRSEESVMMSSAGAAA
jgi:hypothetical protein